jgi:ribonuclease BN (tRNA processing enzyme)
MLTLTFLGVGSAFAKRNFQSNLLFEGWRNGPGDQEVPDDTLLVDFGSTGPLALYHLMQRPGFGYLARDGQINYSAIRRIFVTHTHADHVGGFEELAIMNAYVFSQEGGGPHRPQMISSGETLTTLWEHSLKGGLGTMSGRRTRLEDYFDTVSLVPGEAGRDAFSMLDHYRFRAFPTDHIQVERKYDWPSCGLFMEDARTRQSVFFSGDTRFDYAAYAGMMEQAHICFHDTQLAEQESPVHTLLSELRTLPEAIRRKTWLYHYGDDWDSGRYGDVPDLFAGWAEPGRRYVILD